jgi:MFS family permease
MKLLAFLHGPGSGRDLNLYWWGQTTSALGSVFTAIALPVVAVVRLAATPGQLALISACAILPSLLLGIPAGALADRVVRPRPVLIAIDTCSAASVAVVAFGLATHTATIWWLAILGAVGGTTGVFFGVVYFLHLRDLVGLDHLAQARARLQVGQYGAGFVGRILAGPAIVLFGSATALGIDAVSFLLSAAALLTMSHPVAAAARQPDADAGGGPLGLAAGVRYFLHDSYHRALMLLLVGPVVANTGVGVLTAPFLLRVVRVPTSVYGLVFSLAGLTGLIGSALAGRIMRPGRDPRPVVPVMFAAAVACALLVPAAAGPLPLAMTCAAVGLALPVLFGAVANVALGPVIMGDAPEGSVGRVTATLQVLVGLGELAGTFLGGVLGDTMGIRPAIWALSAGSVAAVAICLPVTLRAGGRAAAGEAVTDELALARKPG